MNLNKYIILAIGLISWGLSGCDDMLDTEFTKELSDKQVWDYGRKAEGVVMTAYLGIPDQLNHYGNNFLDAATDNAVTNDYSSNVYALGGGSININNQAPIGIWDKAYENIRHINLFLENGTDTTIRYHEDSAQSKIDRERYTGEAYFLRAWWSWELLKVYGGVSADGEALGYVIVNETPDLDNNITKSLQRNTYEECAKQIFADCDSAYKLLLDKVRDPGRADYKAALALRARVALYAASEAYQPDTISDYGKEQKWRRAAAFCDQAITIGNLGAYTALTQTTMVGGNLNSNTPTEYIFRTYYNNRDMESRNRPPSYYGKGGTNPSQNLVDAFSCSNGYPITHPNNNYDANNPFENRDNRLALFILYNGRTVDASGDSLRAYYDLDRNILSTDAPGGHFQSTRTGYYLRKWMSEKANMLSIEYQNDFHVHPLLRRAEVYLSYAEASNMAIGPGTPVVYDDGDSIYTCSLSAINIIDDIRTKSGGLPTGYAGSLGKEGLDSLILNERRIELAFENHRYFDMRRRMLKLNEPIRGMTVTYDSINGYVYAGTDPKSEPIIVEERKFGEKYYTPLPYDELKKSPLMKNNKGW